MTVIKAALKCCGAGVAVTKDVVSDQLLGTRARVNLDSCLVFILIPLNLKLFLHINFMLKKISLNRIPDSIIKGRSKCNYC